MVLLIGLVLTGSVTIVVLGASVLSDAQEGTQLEAAELHLQEFGSRLSTLAGADADPSVEFDAGETTARDYRIERDGYLNVTVDRRGECSFNQSLSTLVYEDSQGRTVGYEAGGVWRGNPDGSAAVSSPSVTFEEGRLNVRLVNLTGTFNQATNVATLNVTRTQNRTTIHREALQQGECVRPDNLTIWVNSRYSTGWRNHLEREIGVPSSNIKTFDNGTVRIFVPQGYLHPLADDNVNNVINFLEAPPPPPNRAVDVPYMDNALLDGGNPSLDVPVRVMADKGAGNTYSAFVEPLTEGTLGIGDELELDGVNVSGPPLDVVLVLDESGSMDWEADGDNDRDWCGEPDPACYSKSDAAKDASQNFLGSLNASRDRVSVVGYDTEGRYHLIENDYYFSSDFDEVNATIVNDITANGGTRMDNGMDYMNALFDLKSSESRRKVAILLTDGRNDCCGNNANTEDAAHIASDRDITTYTVGYGGDSYINETLLRNVATITNGKYCQAENASSVDACFQAIGDQIKPQSAIASMPITSNITTSTGQLLDADIPGETSHIARVTSGSETFLNVNDPTAPSLFTHSYAVEDGEESTFNLTRYDCKPGAWNLTGRTRTVNGTTMTVARCTDIGPKNGTFAADIYLDGERPTTLLETTYAGWQDDVNASLDRFDSVNINASTGKLEAGSNQALLVFDLPPQGSGTRNTLALLVQIGLSETDAAGEAIVTVRVAESDLVSS